MAVTDKEPVADLDRIGADAERSLVELREARGRLSLDALVDSTVNAELQQVEAEIALAEQAIERVALARSEQARRQQAAAQATAQAAREQARERSRVLQVERETAVRAFDSAAQKLAHSLADYARITVDQTRELRAAGRSAGGPAPSSAIERALAFALEAAKAPRGMIDLPPLSGPPAPLADLDPRHVETAEAK